MILLIDTSQEKGFVALARGAEVIQVEENEIAKEHASWLHLAIGRILTAANLSVRDLQAVAVVAGPGSYTGLRVAMAAAKGFCYAIKIPMITQNSLVLMAESMKTVATEKGAWICPMIDARREEVFTALYQATENTTLQEILAPQAMILDKNSFESELLRNPIVFSGSGAGKWEKITNASRAIFAPQNNIVQSFARLAAEDFAAKKWTDPLYAAPVYLKEFFSY
jgi:tRNA threonylcarbamoyladenosine biosynthesis protein TsaB